MDEQLASQVAKVNYAPGTAHKIPIYFTGQTDAAASRVHYEFKEHIKHFKITISAYCRRFERPTNLMEHDPRNYNINQTQFSI